MTKVRAILIWAALGIAVIVPTAVAATSPLLAWRDPIYVAAGFAGIAAMTLILTQPLLAAGYLPGLPVRRGRRVHRWIGGVLVASVVFHVVGLWLTSPPDVIDALLFTSPTPFSAWGVIAMWALFGTALLAAFRTKIGIPPRVWRIGHTALAAVIVVGSVVHAMLIEGTMGTISKAALCAFAVAATAKALIDLRPWTLLSRPDT